MKNVDRIIKYLSGDMSRDEAGSFENDLNSNPILIEEFEQVSMAYNLIRNQLRQRDEAAFKAKLLEVMSKPVPPHRKNISGPRFMWRFLLPIAASAAILVSVFVLTGRRDNLVDLYFQPQKDPVVLAFSQETRSASAQWITLYNEGRFPEATKTLQKLIELEPDNHMAMLFYLLASIKTDQEGSALILINADNLDLNHQLGRSVTWYMSLAMIKMDQKAQAAIHLQSLSEIPGNYNSDARRLRKRLLK